jgi:hypothetical protein
MTDTRLLFPNSPVLTLFDPLGAMLGAGDGHYHYTFDDAVKLAGHACPTVAGAFVTVKRALELLYGDEMPCRGDLEVRVTSAMDSGTTGPFSQVVTLLTGAAGLNGFHGLNGRQVRQGLLTFEPPDGPAPVVWTFRRISTDTLVNLRYDPSSIAPADTLNRDMQAVLDGTADADTAERFRAAWRDRVERILEDGGISTVFEIPPAA